MIEPQVMILDSQGEKNSLYTSWSSLLKAPCVFLNQYDMNWTPPENCGLLVTAQHYQEPEFGILRRALEKGTPTLIIADGILEYRNTWMNPGLAPGSLFQPVVGHKIACLGRSQARVLESWGNLGKCEIVGCPRFDSALNRKPRRRNVDEPFRFLIVTARNPGFTSDQTALAKRSLQDLKFWFVQHPRLNDIVLEPVWRLTQGLEKEIGVKNHSSQFSGSDLAELLQSVDAVITTPSTTMLEAMLHGLPVALLDYNNCPHYVPAAWIISAPRHIDQVLPELLAPPSTRMLYQDTVRHDALECRAPATARMTKLVEEMIAVSQRCRARNEPLVFPRRILMDDQDNHHLPEERFDLKKLYPGHPVFAEMDRAILQVEAEHLRHEVRTLQKTLKGDNFSNELLRSFPGPRKLLRLWRESRRKSHGQ